nr:MAG TPA: hypothetical protein [Caudoviricetes sp.]
MFTVGRCHERLPTLLIIGYHMKNLSLPSPNILYPASRLKIMIVISIIFVCFNG